MARFQSSISLSGPFFRRDPRKTFRQNIRLFMDAVVREGERDVALRLAAGEPGRRPVSSGVQPARVADHVRGRTSSLSGKRWAVTGVVSISTVGYPRRKAIALRAAAARVEAREHAFRKTTARLRRAKAINQVELLKGLQ